jgi:hypothetical protein
VEPDQPLASLRGSSNATMMNSEKRVRTRMKMLYAWLSFESAVV